MGLARRVWTWASAPARPQYAEAGALVFPALLIVACTVAIVVATRLFFAGTGWPWHAQNIWFQIGVLVAALVVIGATLLWAGMAAAIVPIAAACGVVPFMFGADLRRWTLWWIVAAAVLCWLVAREFSRPALRTAAVAAFLTASLLVVRLGQQAIATERSDVTALTEKVAQLQPVVDGEVDAARTAASTSRESLAEAIAVADADQGANDAVVEAARTLGGVLPGGSDNDIRQARDDLDALAVQNDLSVAARAMVDAAHAAADAALASSRTAHAHDEREKRLDELRSDVTTLGLGKTIDDENAEERDAIERRQFDRDVAATDHGLATLGVEVAAPGFSADDVESADEALQGAQAKLDEPLEPKDVREVISVGARELFQGVPVLGNDDVPVELATVGWLVLAGLAIAAYRWLEVRNGFGAPGPVNKIELTGIKDDDKQHEARLRMSILQNVDEPGGLPGATTTQPVTDLLDAAPEQTRTIMKAVVGFLQVVISPKRGYEVAAVCVQTDGAATDVTEPKADGADDGSTVVFVRVLNARTGGTCASKTLTDADAKTAIGAAGYWAAGWILGEATTVPKWARWEEDSEKALSTYYDTTSKRRFEDLKNALQNAPTSGVLLTLTGVQHDLNGEYADALVCYLRAATLYPRYVAARYRLAISLGAIASVSTQWTNLPEEKRLPLCQALERFESRANMPAPRANDLRSATGPAAATHVLSQMALDQLRQLRVSTRWLWVLHQALRRSERRYWFPLAGVGRLGTRRTLLHWTARSAAPVMSLRAQDVAGAESAAARLERESDKPDTWYQVLYNLACYRSQRAARFELAGDEVAAKREIDAALTWLEATLAHPGVGQLVQGWTEQDPDLAPLAEHPRFKQFQRQLQSSGVTGV